LSPRNNQKEGRNVTINNQLNQEGRDSHQGSEEAGSRAEGRETCHPGRGRVVAATAQAIQRLSQETAGTIISKQEKKRKKEKEKD
jgi:hypothetical protein